MFPKVHSKLLANINILAGYNKIHFAISFDKGKNAGKAAESVNEANMMILRTISLKYNCKYFYLRNKKFMDFSTIRFLSKKSEP